MKDDKEILDELKGLIDDELKSVSYKWLARHYTVPANYAKQLLFSFVESRRGSVNVTYMLAGWTKATTPQHQISIVGESQLKEAKKKLDPITSLHVYSIQPSQPKEAAELWNTLSDQTSALFDEMVIGKEQNCMWGSTLGAVACPEAVRDPELAQKVLPNPAPEPEPVKKAPGKLAGKIGAAMAGKAADPAAKGASSASVAVTGSKPKESLANGPKSAPVEREAAKPAAKGKSMASMWSKAPPKKAPAPAAKPAAVPENEAAASDGDGSSDEEVPEQPAGRASYQEEGSDSDDEAPAPRKSPAQSKAQAKGAGKAAAKPGILQGDSDSEDDLLPRKKASNSTQAADSDSEDGQPAARRKPAAAKGKAGKGGKAAGGKARAALLEDSEDDDPGAADQEAKPASKKRGRPKKASQAADDEDDEETAKVGRKAAAKPAFGSVKAGAAANKRRKVTQTVINDKGEEVTETVWEEDPADPAAGGDGDEKVEPSQEQVKKPAAPEPAAAAKKAPASAPLKSPGKAAPKKGGAKAKPAGQKGIMSFFGKK